MNRIESARNMEEEGLSNMGFTQLEYEWYEGGELDVVKKVVPVDQVGCDMPIDGVRFVGNELKSLRVHPNATRNRTVPMARGENVAGRRDRSHRDETRRQGV